MFHMYDVKKEMDRIKETVEKQEIPKPPEMREIPVKEVKAGPLFLKQSKYFESLDLLNSMEELISSVKEEIYSLNETLKNDVTLLENLDHLISDLESNNTGLRDIIKPK